jgi:cytochrome c oxidase assembly protein subunit 15
VFQGRFTQYAWLVTLYTIGVIMWGAVVRATGSGAGCGNHWPLCNGEVVPLSPSMETIIEFSHRLTSAFLGVLIIILLVWAFRRVASTRFTKQMAIMSFIFVIIEGGLGMALVRLELVADNVSTARAFMIALHLVNTLVLLAFLALTAWSSQPLKRKAYLHMNKTTVMLFVGMIILAFIGASGAVTALGDTLFPPELLREGAFDNVDATSQLLIDLRVIHPIAAVIGSALFFVGGWFIKRQRQDSRVEFFVNALFVIIAFQTFIGIVNIALLAPVIVSLIHLFTADMMWILLVLLAGEVLYPRADQHPVSPETRAPSLQAQPAMGD